MVPGDSDKYLATSKKFLNILKKNSPKLEVFSIDEAFLELTQRVCSFGQIAKNIKQRIKTEIGEWVKCSIGISYNKVIAKLASSLYKPDGLVTIEDLASAQMILDNLLLDYVSGIGSRIKKRLNNMGIFSFKTLRKIPLEPLIASFKLNLMVIFCITSQEVWITQK